MNKHCSVFHEHCAQTDIRHHNNPNVTNKNKTQVGHPSVSLA